MHACPMKRLGACKHHNPTIREIALDLSTNKSLLETRVSTCRCQNRSDRCDAMRCDERGKTEKVREREKAVNHASDFKSDTVKSFRSDL